MLTDSRVKLAALTVAATALTAGMAAAQTVTPGTAYQTVTVDGVDLGQGTEGERGLSATVIHDGTQYHMWYKATGDVLDDGERAGSLYFGDIPTFNHATSSDGINFTTQGTLSYLSGDPGVEPALVFPRVSVEGGEYKLITWTWNGGGPAAYSYNGSVSNIGSNPNTLAVAHQGAVVGTAGLNTSPLGIVETPLGTRYFTQSDIAGPTGGIGSFVYGDTSPPTATNIDQEATTQFQIGETINAGDGVVHAFFGDATWQVSYGSPLLTPPRYDITHMYSLDGGLTWSAATDIFGGNGSLITIDGLSPSALSIYDAPDIAVTSVDLVNQVANIRLYFNANQNDGSLVMVTGTGTISLIPEPAGLGLLAASGLLVARRRRGA